MLLSKQPITTAYLDIETLKEVSKLICPQEYTAFLDLQDRFLYTLVRKAYRKYLLYNILYVSLQTMTLGAPKSALP
ncbi:hypothetical protein CLU79DRAFT_757073 [Phycomyces nitens]|nr:hypothetical protein CLU79DRAFT_757073 [Phycomyces nitens]